MRGILILLAPVGTLPAAFMIVVELRRGHEARQAIELLEQDIAGLEAAAARLNAIIENGDNDIYREQLARRQGFMMPDETRIVIIGIP